MDSIFMNSQNCKTSKPHGLILTLTNKIDLQRDVKVMLYQISAFTIHGKT